LNLDSIITLSKKPEFNIPVIVVITKIDQVSDDERVERVSRLKKEILTMWNVNENDIYVIENFHENKRDNLETKYVALSLLRKIWNKSRTTLIDVHYPIERNSRERNSKPCILH